MLVASAYCPRDYSRLIDSINARLAKVIGDRYELIAILEDFNINQTPGISQPAIRLENSFSIGNDLKQLICEPKRITKNLRTIIDLLVVNNEHNSAEILMLIGISQNPRLNSH